MDPYVRAWLGLFGSVIFFGIMYAPARKYRSADGVIFQFLMSCGILAMGFLLQGVSVVSVVSTSESESSSGGAGRSLRSGAELLFLRQTLIEHAEQGVEAEGAGARGSAAQEPRRGTSTVQLANIINGRDHHRLREGRSDSDIVSSASSSGQHATTYNEQLRRGSLVTTGDHHGRAPTSEDASAFLALDGATGEVKHTGEEDLLVFSPPAQDDREVADGTDLDLAHHQHPRPPTKTSMLATRTAGAGSTARTSLSSATQTEAEAEAEAARRTRGAGSFLSMLFFITPYGILGGVLWGLSNIFVLASVKFLGLGVGFTLYHAINLTVSYCVGRFTLFGVPKEPPKTVVQDFSQLINIVAFVLVMLVETDTSRSGSSSLAPAQQGAVGGIDEQKPKAAEVGGGGSTPETTAQGGITTVSNASSADEGTTTTSKGRGQEAAAAGVSSTVPATPLRGEGGPPKTSTAEQIPTSAGHILHQRPVFTSDEEDHEVDGATAPSSPADGRGPRASEGAYAQLGSSTNVIPTRINLKKIFGFVFGLLAGLLCGLNQVPFLIWVGQKEHHPEKPDVHLFTLSQCLGIWFISAATFFLYYLLLTNLPPDPATDKVLGFFKRKQLQKVPPLWAGCLPGAFWATGFFLGLDGVAIFGLGIGYVLTAVGPVAVSGMIATLVFDEIQGVKEKLMFWTAISLMAISQVVLIYGGK